MARNDIKLNLGKTIINDSNNQTVGYKIVEQSPHQTCLEKRAIEERQKEIVKNTYKRSYANDNGRGEENYSARHKNAISDGDSKGKGTLHGGHTSFRPSQGKPSSMIDYSNFDTKHGGSREDVEMRKQSEILNLYDNKHEYGYNLVMKDERKK